MPEHECQHEGDFAVLSRMEKILNNIDKTLRGDNGQGLVTRVAVNRTRIKQIAVWLAVITSGIGSIAFFIIRAGLLK